MRDKKQFVRDRSQAIGLVAAVVYTIFAGHILGHMLAAAIGASLVSLVAGVLFGWALDNWSDDD